MTVRGGTEALPKPTKGEQKRMSVAEFVEAKFAAFDRFYGPDSLDEAKKSSCSNSGNDAPEVKAASKKHTHKIKNEELESDEDEDACVTLTYFALLTSLYLPLLLFLWIRRSVFGASSLIRSLFLGHILRLILAFLLLPPSTTKTLVPACLWNAAVSTATRIENTWNDKKVQAMIPGWIHLCLAILLGTGDGSHGSIGGTNNSNFPPALTAFAIFTALVFVVHPDGLTWIMLGRLRDTVQAALQKKPDVIRAIKEGSINLTPIEISGTIAGFFIFYTIICSVVFPKRKKFPSSPQREKSRHKSKKGKKGRGGRNHHGSASGGKAKIRGGHYRAARDMCESSTQAPSRSPSPSNRQRCDSDMEETTVSAISELNIPSFDGLKKESRLKSKVEQCGPDNSEMKPTLCASPSESRLEDENSCVSSLETHISNPASTQEGRKQNHRKVCGKKGRRNVPNSNISTHQVQQKEKNQRGEPTSTQTGSSDEPFVSGHMRQSHQGSHTGHNRKKKPRSWKAKGKTTHRVQKPDFQNYSSSSFFSTNVEKRRALTAPEMSLPRLNEICDRERVVTKSPSSHLHDNSMSMSESPCLEEVQQTTSSRPCVTSLNTGINTLPNYSVPNYKDSYSYCNADGGYSPGKQDLAATEILDNVKDVKALEKLTDSEYICGIDCSKQAEIKAMMDSKRPISESTLRKKDLKPWNTGINPPPGLVPNLDAAATASEALTNTGYYRNGQSHKPSSLSSTTLRSSPGSSYASSSSRTLETSKGKVLGSTESMLITPKSFDDRLQFSPSSFNPVAVPIWVNEQNLSASALRNDEKIEADLQELGGQMAGSILDF